MLTHRAGEAGRGDRTPPRPPASAPCTAPAHREGPRPWPAAPSRLCCARRALSFFPNRRPMDDLRPLRLAPRCKESSLLLLLLGLLPGSSRALRGPRGEKTLHWPEGWAREPRRGGRGSPVGASNKCRSRVRVGAAAEQGGGAVRPPAVSRRARQVGAAPPTSCLLPGSRLGGRASPAAASWVRKEEKSHILRWLYPLGSLPETLATEQTVEPSGVEGGVWRPGPENGAGMQQGPWGGRGQEGGARTLTSSLLLCFLKSLGWKRERG